MGVTTRFAVCRGIRTIGAHLSIYDCFLISGVSRTVTHDVHGVGEELLGILSSRCCLDNDAVSLTLCGYMRQATLLKVQVPRGFCGVGFITIFSTDMPTVTDSTLIIERVGENVYTASYDVFSAYHFAL